MKRHRTQITVWPAITDLMTSMVIISILVGAIGYSYLNKNPPILEAQEDIRKHILGKLKESLDNQGIKVDTLSEQGILRLSEDAVNFPLGDVEPKEKHRENVGWLAQALAEVVPCHVFSDREAALAGTSIASSESSTNRREEYCQSVAIPSTYNCEETKYPWLLETILIEGHTDSIKVGEENRFRNNLELSSMRAAFVYDMISNCEPRIRDVYNSWGTPVLSTSGYGDMRPVHTDSLDKNRRVDIRLILEPPK